jgi:hypothetical protein
MCAGTSLEAAISIQAAGFQRERSGTNAGAKLGHGTYITTTLEKAMGYAKKMPHAGCVFILQVDLGKCLKLAANDTMRKTWHEQGYDSAWLPKDAVGVAAEEHCVWDPMRIKIVDVVLGNTREALAAGFQRASVLGNGRLENGEMRRAREEQENQRNKEEAERKLAQHEQNIQQAKQREAEIHREAKQVASQEARRCEIARRQEENTARLSRTVSARAIAGPTEELLNMTSDVAKDMVDVVREVCDTETKRAKREGRAEQGLKGIRNTFLDGPQSIQTLAQKLDRRETQLRVRAGICDNSELSVSTARAWQVMVFGEGKNGKSTVLNALLGEELLPSGQRKLTGNLTIIRTIQDSTGMEKAGIHRMGEDESHMEPIELLAACPGKSRVKADYVTNDSIDRLHIFHRHEILKHGVILMDVPGMNQDHERDEKINRAVDDCHMLLVICDATKVTK